MTLSIENNKNPVVLSCGDDVYVAVPMSLLVKESPVFKEMFSPAELQVLLNLHHFFLHVKLFSYTSYDSVFFIRLEHDMLITLYSMNTRICIDICI